MSQNIDESKKRSNKLFSAVADIGKAASEFAAKAQETVIDAVDKNNDGKIDAADFGLTEENFQELKERLTDAKLENERKSLSPVFIEDLASESNSADTVRRMSKMINIVEHDKKRDESVVCQGSIGYLQTIKGMDVLCIYDDCVQQLNMSFVPNALKGVYYAEPYQENVFVDMNKYVGHIKEARVTELQMIAQKLGAKHIKVTFKEQQKNETKKKGLADMGFVKRGASASVSQNSSEQIKTEIVADVKFSGHDMPIVPELIYFKNESEIEGLVQMRTGPSENRIQGKTYTIACSKSFGIKEDEAAKIDAVLGQLKCGCSQSFTNEVKKEMNTILEYTIEF